MAEGFRALPSVDRLLQTAELRRWESVLRREFVVEAARAELGKARAAVAAGGSAMEIGALAASIDRRLEELASPLLRRVINATGVIIQTNLGRAPLSDEAAEAARAAASGYSNLEFDLETGGRGSRGEKLGRVLSLLTGAEDALAVNNNAGAVLLALTGLAHGREVIVSRGQAVEVGGRFRIPDVMRQSGARLVEVGTTNRTYIQDYEEALTPETALLLSVHTSNFRMIGFTASAGIRELVELGARHGVPVMDDVGSGCLLDTSRFGLAHEPTPQESIAAGAGIVCFSGDKLLGGPQSGLIVGKRDLVGRLKAHPLARVLRLDKMAIASLGVTLLHYLRGEEEEKLPMWRMIGMTLAEVEGRTRGLSQQIGTPALVADVADGLSTIGGGSLPGETLPTKLLSLRPADEQMEPEAWAARFARELRSGSPPVVARVERGAVLLDLRTVFPSDEQDLVRLVREVSAASLRK